MTSRHYRNLVVWQRAIALVPRIYRLIQMLPREERYALSDQLRRAAISVPANIAEGQARRHPKEFLQHLSVAKGSLAELHTLLIVAQRLDYISEQALLELEESLGEIGRPLHGLIATIAVKSRKPNSNNQQPATSNLIPKHAQKT